MINNGNRTSCRPIQSVIILVIKQIGLPLCGRPILLITRMITDRIGLHSVLLPLHKICPMLYFCNCICNCLGSFHSTKIPVRNFGNSTCPMERYIPVAQTRTKAPRVWLLFLMFLPFLCHCPQLVLVTIQSQSSSSNYAKYIIHICLSFLRHAFSSTLFSGWKTSAMCYDFW